MKLKVYFFKFVYVIRKRAVKLKNTYLRAEYKYLYGERVMLPEEFDVHPLPDFHFDSSKSKVILHSKVLTRGCVSFLFYNNGVIEVGANTFINSNCSFNCFEQIKIGQNCLIGENVKIYDHNHEYRNKTLLIKDQGYTTAPVLIGNNCWIGSDVVILKGVTIGDNVVVGANCVVHKDIPADSVLMVNTGNQLMRPVL